ncbi:hypothetical protein ANRL4_00101 [Anaerolineae bacterium]|nr:hypothetical protein ANRL4_00101 [Anaerolineae bacterium]
MNVDILYMRSSDEIPILGQNQRRAYSITHKNCDILCLIPVYFDEWMNAFVGNVLSKRGR